ncbi:unnamed protein product [Durusdinium trenchii]|uniref:Uncharacterized protein n=1 Tax=Durusdinium trenchii TaxID=1381693 RepID=A0ABP0K5C3_9DINO
MLLCFFGLLWCFAQVAFQEIFKSEPNEAEHVVPPRSVQVPFVEPAESIKQEALPAMCPQLLSAMHAPFIVLRRHLCQDSDGGWSLNIFSQNSHRVLLSATLQLRDSQRKSSCVEVRHLEKDELLGTVTSNLEVLLPDGRTYGRLLAHKGAYLLQEENGREARWSMAAEEGRISIIWLPRRGVRHPGVARPQRRSAQARWTTHTPPEQGHLACDCRSSRRIEWTQAGGDEHLGRGSGLGPALLPGGSDL